MLALAPAVVATVCESLLLPAQLTEATSWVCAHLMKSGAAQARTEAGMGQVLLMSQQLKWTAQSCCI